jgi:hypothetical protein
VAAVDADPLRLAMAAQNLAAYGYRERVTLIQDDVTQMQLPTAEAFFFDPARRAGGRRKFSVRHRQRVAHAHPGHRRENLSRC